MVNTKHYQQNFFEFDLIITLYLRIIITIIFQLCSLVLVLSTVLTLCLKFSLTDNHLSNFEKKTTICKLWITILCYKKNTTELLLSRTRNLAFVSG